MGSADQPTALLARSDAEYAALGLSATEIAVWEDGARTDGGRGTYEWWYFDAQLDDGAKAVVAFANKDIADSGGGLDPRLHVNLELPGGRALEKDIAFASGQWSAATDHADVRLGENRFTGDLHTYRIIADAGEVAVDFTLTGTVPAWRPATGYLLFGGHRDRQSAWLPSVPHGAVSGTCVIDGVATEVTGTGYHDHNWGNVAMPAVVNDWYWARGQAGPYSVIASYITASKKYGFAAVPIFMLARDGQIVADDADLVLFSAEDIYTDTVTGKPVAATTRYTYACGADRYEVTFSRDRDLVRTRMPDELHGMKKLAARLAGFDGAYLRFAGTLTIARQAVGQEPEQHASEAIWELMYFGHARKT